MDDPRKKHSLFESLRIWLMSPRAESQPASRGVAEEMNKALPESLSAHSAIEQDRERKRRLIDQMLEEANR